MRWRPSMRTAVCLLLSGILAPNCASAWTFKVLQNLAGGNPGYGSLVKDDAGNLYGTTVEGGSGAGTVFKVAPEGTLSVLHTFGGQGDGAFPWNGVVKDSAGNLYGTTCGGGKYQAGTIFKLAPDGTETILHSLDGYHEGGGACSRLLKDGRGNLYSMALNGGDGDCHGVDGGCGTVFELKSDGTFAKLHDFSLDDGEMWPAGRLALDKQGNLYGTTSGNEGPYYGTVFKLAPDGTETVLHIFSGAADGNHPNGALKLDEAGNLYGTTDEGGNGCGVVYRISPKGTEKVLHAFGAKGGCGPEDGVVIDQAGNMYGDTLHSSSGHRLRDGTVYELNAGGGLSYLHRFYCETDGCVLPGGLLQDDSGNLYGITFKGGLGNGGTIFELIK